MKRIVFFIIIIAILVAPMLASQSLELYYNLDCVESVFLVTTEKYDFGEDAGFIQNGNQNIYSFEVEKFVSYIDEIDNYDGLVFNYDKNTTFEDLRKKWKISYFYSSNLGEMKIIYAFCPTVNDFRWIEGKKINLQIAWSEDKVSVGLPLILTGF